MPRTAKLTHSAWFDAADKGDLDQLKAWNEAGDLLRAYDPSRHPSLGKQGRPRPLDFMKSYGRETALHVALDKGHLAYAQQLLVIGSPSFTPTRTKDYPLHLLLRNAGAGQLPLLLELIGIMIERGHPLEVEDNLNRTPLRHAVERACLNILPIGPAELLVARGARPDKSCLRFAVSHSKHEIVEKLLSWGANPIDPVDPWSGETVLHCLACLWEQNDHDRPDTPNRRILEALIAAGADPYAKLRERNRTTGEPQELTVFDCFRQPQWASSMFAAFAKKQAQDQQHAMEKATPQAAGAARPPRL